MKAEGKKKSAEENLLEIKKKNANQKSNLKSS